MKGFFDAMIRPYATHIGMVKYVIAAKHRPVAFHSMERSDRSGAKIHDELMAYAFCFNNGLRYDGPVSDRTDDGTVALRHMLGLPEWTKGDRRKANLLTMIYRDSAQSHGSYHALKWALAVLGLRVPHSPDEIFTPAFVSHLRSRAKLSCDPVERCVVLHIRRGDVSSEAHPKRFTGTDVYMGIIEALKNLDAELRFIVHSQSQNMSSEEIGALRASGADIRLDAPLQDVWTDMIQAECLVLSKSSFSYVPGVFCRGIVLYQPSQWHDKLRHWITLEGCSPQQVHDRMLAARAHVDLDDAPQRAQSSG